MATSHYRVLPTRPRPLIMALVLSLIAALAAVGVTRPAAASTATPSTAADRAELAQWWAPVHFQDVDTSGETAFGGESDYITSYDFDGDLNGRNNWENASEFPLAAHVYYSVVQTPSFTYLIYMFFHPRDWADAALDDYEEDATEHENDSEGVLVTVANDGSAHGVLKAVVSVAHSHFYSWLPDGSDFSSGDEDVDGAIATTASPHGDGHQRPWTAQQAGTHAAWAMGATRDPSPDLGDQYRNGDGILYYPGSTAEVPESANDRDVQYTLTDIFAPGGMWEQRNNTSLFAKPNNFAGDDSGNPNGAACGEGGVAGPADGDCGTDSANPPWAWDDADDSAGRGYIATNPAQLVWDYFSWPGKPSSPDLNYTWDAYNGITPADPAGGSGSNGGSGSGQIAVASYIHPNATDGSGNVWDRLNASPSSKVSVVVANVLNGPDSKVNTDWKRVIDAAAGSGKRVLGYVPTGYLGLSTTRPTTRLGSNVLADWIAQIEQDVNKWHDLYGSSIGGIFFDEGFNECGAGDAYVDVYRHLNQYAKKKFPGSMTVLNPGTIVPQCYEDSADVLMTFESDYLSYYGQNSNTALNYKDLGWTPADPHKIWHIIYGVPADHVADVAQKARDRGAGYLQITDDTLTNPYDTLPAPAYWSAEQAAVSGGTPAIAAPDAGSGETPQAPSGLSVLDPSSLDYTSVKLTWAPSAGGAYRYRVYVNGKHVVSLPGSMNIVTIGGLDTAGTYQVYVTAEGSTWGNESAPTNTVSATTLALPHGVPIENLQVSLSGASATYSADFLVPYSFRRLYILRDPADTTTPCYWTLYGGGKFVCSVYMLENNRLLSYAGTGTDWTWNQVGGATEPAINKYTYSWLLPLGDNPTPKAARDQFMVQGEGYGPFTNVVPPTVTPVVP